MVDTEQKGDTTLDSSDPKTSSSSVPAQNLIPSSISEIDPPPRATTQALTAVKENLSTHKTAEKLPHTRPVHQADVPAIPHCREEPISHDRQSQETETMSSETKNGGSSLDRPPLLASAAAVTGHTLDPDISPLAAYQSDQTDMMTGTDKRVTERQTDDDTSPAAYQSHDNHLLINVTQNTEPSLIEAAANGKDSGVPADQNDNPITHKHAEIEQLTHYSSTYYNSALITIGGQQL